jgi:hypothetical protein
MSYNIIKNIRKTNEGVYLTYADSSLTDDEGNYVIYPESKNEYFSEIYLNEGNDEFLKAILMEFWSGNFQGSYGGYKQFCVYLRTIEPNSLYNRRGRNYDHNNKPSKEDMGGYLLGKYKDFQKIKNNKFLIKIIKGEREGWYFSSSSRICSSVTHAKSFSLAMAIKLKSECEDGTIELIAI